MAESRPLYDTGQMKMDGLGGPRQPVIANALFEAACQAETVSGALAQHITQSHNLSKAAERFKSACELGDSESCAAYGTQLLLGAEGSSGISDGLSFLRTACEDGALEGCLGLADAYKNGTGVQSNPEQGSEFAQVACQGGLGAGCTCSRSGKLSLWGQGDASLLMSRL